MFRTRAFRNLVVKFASLETLLGGPLLVSNALRPVLGPMAAVVVVVVPVVLLYMGADALSDPERGRSRAAFIRLGLLGALLIAPMNAMGIAELAQGRLRREALTIAGVVLCTAVIVTYLVLASRALRGGRTGADAAGDDGTPIE